MNGFCVIDSLDATHQGPFRVSDGTLIHLRQGDADGACGPYVVFMALMVLGLADRDVVTSWGRNDGRTKLGKLINLLGERSKTLFRDGTSTEQLMGVLDTSFGRDIGVEFNGYGGKATISYVVSQLQLGRPVMLLITGNGVSHFVLAIGFARAGHDDSQVQRILVLDPGDPAPTVCAWNGVIEARGTGGLYPYTWWTSDDGPAVKVQFTCALALWRTRQ